MKARTGVESPILTPTLRVEACGCLVSVSQLSTLNPQLQLVL